MDIRHETSPTRVILTTNGRKTDKKHSVMLLAVVYNTRIYFSRHRADSDWFKNAIAEPAVSISYEGHVFVGNAKMVTDEYLQKKISQLKYPGQQRASERRVVIEVTLNDS